MHEKTYYWLKLQNDFFTQPRMKRLRQIAGGDTYTIIYLKMQLLSLQNEGYLYYEHITDSFEDDIALTIDEDVDNVKVTISFLKSQGLLIESESGVYELPETKMLIGCETAAAARMRKYRDKKNGTAIDEEERNNVTPMLQQSSDIAEETADEEPKESEPDVSKNQKKKPEKHKYGEYQHVLLADKERDTLFNDYGEAETLQAIKYLDEYIEMKGYKAKNHYLAMRKWVFDAVKEQERKKERQGNSGNNGIDWSRV